MNREDAMLLLGELDEVEAHLDRLRSGLIAHNVVHSDESE